MSHDGFRGESRKNMDKRRGDPEKIMCSTVRVTFGDVYFFPSLDFSLFCGGQQEVGTLEAWEFQSCIIWESIEGDEEDDSDRVTEPNRRLEKERSKLAVNQKG